MGGDLKQSLQTRWEASLTERASLSPASLVPALDSLLAPIRERIAQSSRDRIKKKRSGDRKNPASQIPSKSGSGTVGDVA
jgi:hypothetical protein